MRNEVLYQYWKLVLVVVIVDGTCVVVDEELLDVIDVVSVVLVPQNDSEAEASPYV